MGSELAKFPTFWEISTWRTLCCQTRRCTGGKMMSGRGFFPIIIGIHHCTSTAQIGYRNGRFYAPNFLVFPAVLDSLESMSKRVRFGARTFQMPNFLRNIHAADPHVVRHVGAQEERYCLGAAPRPSTNRKPPRCTSTAQIGH